MCWHYPVYANNFVDHEMALNTKQQELIYELVTMSLLRSPVLKVRLEA